MGDCCSKKDSDFKESKHAETDSTDKKKNLFSRPAIQKLSNRRIYGNGNQIIPLNIKNNHLVREQGI
jgi:hypothetical protein